MNNKCIAYFRDSENIELDINKKYIVKVRGWPMLSKIQAGTYRIEPVYVNDWIGYAVDFYRPRGHKRIARHQLVNLSFMTENCSDLNGVIFCGVAEI